MKRLFFSLCAVGLSCAAFGAGPEVNIVPKPLSVTPGAGTFTVTASTVIGVGKNAELRRSARIFAGEVAPVVGGVMKTAAEGDVRLAVDGSLEAEAYTLAVTPSGVEVRGGTPQGVFHGLQSLRQLVIDGEGVVPAVTVSDKPYFAHRGGMLDPCRHFWTVDEVKEYIDILAIHKLNKFHWHLTDDQGWRIEIKKYPELTRVGSVRGETLIGHHHTSSEYDKTPHGGYYTQKQIREIVKYAADRYITVIPEIELPGHAVAALTSYPWLGCKGEGYEVRRRWGISKEVFCPGKETTFEFLQNVFAEVLELFPSEFIHIGGDECPKVRWEKCPVCQAKIRELGIEGDDKHAAEYYLQSYVTARVEKFLNEHGRRIIGWDEILEGELAPDATVMSWRGSEGGIAAARLGHDAIMTPTSHFYFDYYQARDIENEPFGIGGYVPVEKVYAYEPIPDTLSQELGAHILGVQANLWAEYIKTPEHQEYMLLPRMAALSEVQWCDRGSREWTRFAGALSHIVDIYERMGYNYSPVVFGVNCRVRSLPEKKCVEVTLSTLGDAPIHYTLDGSEPTAESPRYAAPIEIRKGCTLKAAALRDGVRSRVLVRNFSDNKAMGHPVTLVTEPLGKYRFGAPESLVDGIESYFSYANGDWAGWFGDPMVVDIDMAGASYGEVRLGTLVLKDEDIFPPLTLVASTSEDGEHFTEAGRIEIPMETSADPDALKSYTVSFPETSARYLRVEARTVNPIPEWHGARGKKGFLFVDEICVN